MRKILTAPSLGCCDLFKMEEQVSFIDQRADFLHIDIKDGNYVKTFGVGINFMEYIKPYVTKPMDAHLMVKHPQDFIESCAKAGASYITPHNDCIRSDAFITLNKIKSLGCKAGIALNPSESLETIRYYLPLLDKVTLMLVDAGYAGQRVIPQVFDKVRELVNIRDRMNLDFLIEVDGSIDKDIYPDIYNSGADIVVLGPPALWNKDKDIEKAWGIMESEIAFVYE